MTPDVRVRDYEPADREACLAVFDTNVPTYFVPEEREQFAAYLDDLSGPYLVLEDLDGLVVACGGWAVERGSDTADLCWGMVRQDLHRGGLGRRLTEERLEAVRARTAAEAVTLATSQHTTGFYERLGFVVVAVEKDGFAPGLDRCDMELRLER